MSLKRFVAFLWVLLTLATAGLAREQSGVVMPDRLDVDGKPLVLNGMGTRKATFLKVKVYVAGLYLQQKSNDPTAIVKSPETKRIVLEFTRDVDKDQMVRAVDNGIKKSTEKNIDQLRPDVAQVVQWLPDSFKQHDTLTFTANKGQSVEVRVNGDTRGTVAGSDFTRALWAVWLGSDPPDNDLKKALLTGE